jgi:predicted ester cyclase
MAETDTAKKLIRNFVDAVWVQGQLARLPEFWTEDCINHAAPQGEEKGLAALGAYHTQFAEAFAAFSSTEISILQQIVEGDRVVTHIITTARHTGEFFGVLATGSSVSLATIRIDRVVQGRIAEHWSIADMAGLMRQLKG